MSTPTRILVYTDGEVMGDGIIRLLFAAALKRALPCLHLTWLSSGYSVYDTVLKEMAVPLIDQLIIIPDRTMFARDFLRGPLPLRGQSFDLIIDTQRRVKRTFWLTRIRHRRFISAAANYLLSAARPSAPPPTQFIEILMQLGELGIGQPLTLQPLPLPTGDWAAQAEALLPSPANYVGFIIGAGHPYKCWPAEHFITLARHASARGYTPVIFLGPKEQDQAAAIRTAIPDAVFPLTENGSPYLTIALAGRLTAAVANDSGGGHLLAAGNAPLVSLFRSASVRKKFLPQSAQLVALAPEDFGKTSMQEIPYDAVQAALDSLLTN